MNSFGDFRGSFGDFETLAHDTDISKYVFCVYGSDGEHLESYKIIVGWTVLPYDIMLHVIDVQDADEKNFDVRDHMEKNGVQFIMLKDFIGKYGADTHPDYQL